MSNARTNRNVHPQHLAALLALAVAASPASAQTPRPGEVQHLKAITLSLEVGSTQKEARQVTYTPPPGWYVRSHAVQCLRKTGYSSYSVTTVPRDWNWVSEETAREAYKALIDMAGKSRDPGLQAKYCLERDQTLQELRRNCSSHHALVLDATARGEGFLKGGGSLQITVVAEMVYVGTDEALHQTVARQRALLQGAARQAAPAGGPGLPGRTLFGTSPGTAQPAKMAPGPKTASARPNPAARRTDRARP